MQNSQFREPHFIGFWCPWNSKIIKKQLFLQCFVDVECFQHTSEKTCDELEREARFTLNEMAIPSLFCRVLPLRPQQKYRSIE